MKNLNFKLVILTGMFALLFSSCKKHDINPLPVSQKVSIKQPNELRGLDGYIKIEYGTNNQIMRLREYDSKTGNLQGYTEFSYNDNNFIVGLNKIDLVRKEGNETTNFITDSQGNIIHEVNNNYLGETYITHDYEYNSEGYLIKQVMVNGNGNGGRVNSKTTTTYEYSNRNKSSASYIIRYPSSLGKPEESGTFYYNYYMEREDKLANNAFPIFYSFFIDGYWGLALPYGKPNRNMIKNESTNVGDNTLELVYEYDSDGYPISMSSEGAKFSIKY